jgi:hypothetical protein
MEWFFQVFAALALAACSSTDLPGEGAGTGGTGSHQPGTGGVTSEAGGDTWANFAEGFFATYCVSCHDGTQSGIVGDFRKSADVTQHKDDIRCGVATTVVQGCEQSKWPPKQFPVGTGPKPTDHERTRLVAWIEAGVPQ